VARLAGVSRASARRLTDEGFVTLGERSPDPADRLAAGDALEIRMPAPDHRLYPEPIPFEVRYEDDDLAVVEKPPGMVVHPGAGRQRGTLAAGLLHRWPELEGVGDEGRWGIVHRLDRDTSGLLLVAKTPEALEGLRTALRRRALTRRYAALVHGGFDAPTGTIDAPIGRDERMPTRRVVMASGRPARTHYLVEESWSAPDLSRLSVTLETGRTHQIRVHLAAIDHPVVGDRTYGRPGPEGVDPGRVWLHAGYLAFPHPATAERVTVEAPLPGDLVASLERLGPPDRSRR
jgi:23S rRNA pseudouridine1911/1915/1917 synthase